MKKIPCEISSKTSHEQTQSCPSQDIYLLFISYWLFFPDFMFVDGEYTFRKFHRGKPIVSKTLDSKQFFQMIKEMSNLEFDLTEIPKKWIFVILFSAGIVSWIFLKLQQWYTQIELFFKGGDKWQHLWK